MTIHVLGTSHRKAGVSAREQLVAARAAEHLVRQARLLLGAGECVPVRTCNRVELYYHALSGPAHQSELVAVMCGPGPVSATASDLFYHHTGGRAVRHLLRVACGVDSMVLGEHEILGQVKESLAEAMANGWAGPVLRRLFDRALSTGRRARRETAISSGIFSVGQCAARMAQEALGGLRGRRVLVFGAGRIARVVVKHMAFLGAGPVAVFSRTRATAEELAGTCGGRAIGRDQLPRTLADSDILVGCASAPHYLISKVDIEAAVRPSRERPLAVIDLGVPRNVDPAVAEVPGVRLFNIDDLETIVNQHAGEREMEVERVGAIVEEEARAFERWLEERSVSDVILEITTKAEGAREECLALARRKLPEEALPTVAYLLDLLARKLLHDPVSALRDAAGREVGGAEVVIAARRLFALPENKGAEVDGAKAPAALQDTEETEVARR